ncbi:SCAN box domain-containing protein [Trichonephila clavipes]|nr:SCAN box domain-containing protein [Trichonephila clavipes]
MAYLAKGNKPDLLSVCEEMGVEVDQSSKVVDFIFDFERKAELALVPKKDWVAYLLAVLPAELSNMLAREPTERANNYDFVKDLILKRVRKHFLDDWIMFKTPYELAEKLDEYESIKQSFRREIPKKNSYKFQGGVNYSGARPKETPKDQVKISNKKGTCP